MPDPLLMDERFLMVRVEGKGLIPNFHVRLDHERKTSKRPIESYSKSPRYVTRWSLDRIPTASDGDPVYAFGGVRNGAQAAIEQYSPQANELLRTFFGDAPTERALGAILLKGARR
jgi:hypothetical protein